jgi:hypothetical protein
MNLDKLRDRAALIFLQHLLGEISGDLADMRVLSCTAYEYADEFIKERPGKCSGCPYNSDMAEAAKALTRGAAGPRKPAKSKTAKTK